MAGHGVKGKGFPGAGFRNRVLESRSRVVCVTCTVQEALLFGLAQKYEPIGAGQGEVPKVEETV